MSDKATFQAAFDGETSVTITIDYDAFNAGGDRVSWLKAEWEGRPGPHIVPQYVAWMHTVMTQVAKRVNQKICYGYEPPPGQPPLVFGYNPDGTYKQIRRPRL